MTQRRHPPGLRRRPPRSRRPLPALCAFLLASGCAASPMTAETPPPRLSWPAYLAGEDLRTSCAAGTPDRFRLVYNADYNQHVRAYDLVAEPATGGAVLEARVIQAPDLARVAPGDPAGPWRGEAARTRLSQHQFALFILQLYESGAFDGTPGRPRVPPGGIWWLVNGCHGGTWFFNAFPYPSDRFAVAGLGAPATLP